MLTLVEADTSTGERSHFYRKEAEHRIANSLQLISSLVRQRARSRDVSDPQTFLLEIADRIETVGKLHRFLGESTTGTVQLRKYQLPAKTALSLGLVTAELISNSLKYAHPAGLPTRISLSCAHQEEGRLMVAYEDDGVGFPEDFDFNETGHMGMNFIRLLSMGLEGHHEWRSDSLGIRFEIVLPISA
jgi:two-component sensor histidine kinase